MQFNILVVTIISSITSFTLPTVQADTYLPGKISAAEESLFLQEKDFLTTFLKNKFRHQNRKVTDLFSIDYFYKNTGPEIDLSCHSVTLKQCIAGLRVLSHFYQSQRTGLPLHQDIEQIEIVDFNKFNSGHREAEMNKNLKAGRGGSIPYIIYVDYRNTPDEMETLFKAHALTRSIEESFFKQQPLLDVRCAPKRLMVRFGPFGYTCNFPYNMVEIGPMNPLQCLMGLKNLKNYLTTHPYPTYPIVNAEVKHVLFVGADEEMMYYDSTFASSGYSVRDKDFPVGVIHWNLKDSLRFGVALQEFQSTRLVCSDFTIADD